MFTFQERCVDLPRRPESFRNKRSLAARGIGIYTKTLSRVILYYSHSISRAPQFSENSNLTVFLETPKDARNRADRYSIGAHARSEAPWIPVRSTAKAKPGLPAANPVAKRLGVMNERKEPPFLIEIGTAVEVNNSGRAIRATSINVGGCGVLLEFQELDSFLVGDPVFCDFNIADQTQNPLPHLA